MRTIAPVLAKNVPLVPVHPHNSKLSEMRGEQRTKIEATHEANWRKNTHPISPDMKSKAVRNLC
jgi:hypothetical protein